MTDFKKGGLLQNSNIYATNRLFVKNPLFKKKKKKRAPGVYNPKGKFKYEDGGEQGCPPGQYWDGKKCVDDPFTKGLISQIKKGNESKKPVPSLTRKAPTQPTTNAFANKPLLNKEIQQKRKRNSDLQKTFPEVEIIGKRPMGTIHGEIPDSFTENLVEFADQSGYFSWDDANQAYQNWQGSDNMLPSMSQAADMFGAVPVLGKLGKLKYLSHPAGAMKSAYKYFPWQQAVNFFDTAEDIDTDNLNQKKDGGSIMDLTKEEIQKYIDGGYVVEEINDPSIPALTKAAKGGANKGCPPGQYWNGVKCTKLITLKNDKKYIDGVANWAMHVSDPNMISGNYNDQIKERLYSGKWGLDPQTGALVKLSAVQPKSVTTLDAKSKADREREKKEQTAQRIKWDSQDTYRQSIIDAGFDPTTFGKAKGVNTITGEPIYASSKEEADRINQEAINQFAIEGHAAVVNNPVFKTAASFTPVGMAVGAVEGLARFIPDAYTLAQDPTLANAGQLGMDALQAAPVIGKPLARTLQSAKGLYNNTVKLANKTKKPLQNVAENIETVEDVISLPPGVPKPPLPNYEIILNRYNQLLNEGDSVLVARGAIADEFGIDAINIINNPPSAVTQPLYTGAIDLRRPSSNQLPNPPDELLISTQQTGASPVNNLENDFQRMMQNAAIPSNITHPDYQLLPFDELISHLRTRPYSAQDVDQLANNPRYRDYYNDVRSRQQASLNQELNNLTNDPSTYLRGEQNINTRPNVDYADKINRIAQDILYPENLTQLNTLNIPGKAKSAAKTLSKKLSDFKSNVSSAINKANVKLGEVIDKSKIETLKKPISAKDIDAEVNKNLAEGLGIKKGDVQIKVKTTPTGKTQVLIKPKEFFKKNKQLIEDTYGKGSFDEWINTVSDDWIDSGYLGLSSTSGEMVQPRKFTEILSGKKLEPSVNFGQGNINVPAPGLKRSGDFPFANWEGGFRENLLENLGVSGELTQAYNKALKSKGYGAYSGGTGHLAPGAKRYVRELLNNRVEVINSDKAEDLYRLLNDESTRNAVNNALKNKNEPLPASIYQAIQPLIFKYKRKGGVTNDYIEVDISEEEIQWYIDNGYIVEPVTKLKKFIG